MQAALATFTHEAMDLSLSWDMKNAANIRGLFSLFSDPDQRHWLEATMEDFEQSVLPIMDRLPAQVIHNDFNMENILVSPQDPDQVTGIIDFGDMVHAPVIFDVAIGAAYQMGDAAKPIDAVCDFLCGYGEIATLSEAEIAALYPCMLMRLAMRIAIPEQRGHLFPEHYAHFTRNTPTVWAQIDRLNRGAKQAHIDQIAAILGSRQEKRA